MLTTGGGCHLSDDLTDKLRTALKDKKSATLTPKQVIEIVRLFEFVDEDEDDESYGI